MSTAPSAPSGSPSFSLARVLIVLVPALVVVGAVYAMKSHELSEATHDKEAKLQAAAGIKLGAAPMKLDDKFTDVDGNLVADPPADAAKQISPDKIVFAFIAGPDAESDKDNWSEFVKYLGEQSGKLVEMVTFKTTQDELQALKDGKLQVCGFNTGAVPLAVNSAGFVPICTRAGDDGQFSDSMEIIVPAGSEIREKHPEDLKGKNITFTERTSNSGYKAAVIYLHDSGLDYPRDYNGSFSSSHQDSIKGILDGVYAVCPVSREVLTRMEQQGDVSADKIKVVYESERFPPATVGYVYNLSPALADKIKAAFLSFSWKGTGLEKQFAGSSSTKFVPVKYKDDFALVRRNNDTVQDPVDVAVVNENQAP